ncbi:DUF2796 domain-containing protein [Aliiroseovarius sp. Z3]|uniref:zinc uptake protein ZrgA n=1 Tax=Aliiroseovarius sp. Z3 TaxID=2811402 RepID=UPI0023B2958A|nr:DUF2796 domain-containing protein [Aliiroseovarius sp. Z3]MDE9450338.1 DUF2796 domain-containing protein [Aliiroseovarius sp. Z3]
MRTSLSLVLAALAIPAAAQESRQLDAHEHGVGELNIAFEGNIMAMELHVPGADIVGFEHAATSAEDRTAIENAVATLARPLELFVLPEGAECTVTQASAELESEESHDQHEEHEEHDDHDDHADDDGHEDHAEEHHEDEAGHTEFHAEYTLTCAHPGAITGFKFAYFDVFQNARELEVQIVSTSGARAFEVERDAPTLDLRGMF